VPVPREKEPDFDKLLGRIRRGDEDAAREFFIYFGSPRAANISISLAAGFQNAASPRIHGWKASVGSGRDTRNH
jgi:hypothetical protein